MTVDDLASMQELLQHHLSIVSQTKGEETLRPLLKYPREFLECTTWHSGQHVRQVMTVLSTDWDYP
jgi:hypothetical protein